MMMVIYYWESAEQNNNEIPLQTYQNGQQKNKLTISVVSEEVEPQQFLFTAGENAK